MPFNRLISRRIPLCLMGRASTTDLILAQYQLGFALSKFAKIELVCRQAVRRFELGLTRTIASKLVVR